MGIVGTKPSFNKSKAVNYRLVLLHSHLMNFLESNKIMSEFQQGFRKRRSCEIQLVTTIHDLTVGLDRRQPVNAVLLDFSEVLIRFHIVDWQSSSITLAPAPTPPPTTTTTKSEGGHIAFSADPVGVPLLVPTIISLNQA